MPMIDFSVVVLPAPLRPSSVTTSPAKTSKVTPWSTWDSPYQACSPSIASSGAILGLSMADPEIGFLDVRVGRDRIVVAFSQHPTTGEHGDTVGEVRDHTEIVLDHQYRAVLGNRLDERADPSDILVSHSRGRLVEQQHFRIEGKRRRNFERALAAVG